MDLTPSDEQRLLRESADRFVTFYDFTKVYKLNSSIENSEMILR